MNENQKKAIEWVNIQLLKPNRFDVKLNSHSTIIDAHKFLMCQLNRLNSSSELNRIVAYRLVKKYKDCLND